MRLRKFLALFLACVVIAASAGTASLGKAKAEPIAHEPVTEVPYGYVGIYTVADLEAIRTVNEGNYILMNDLDLTEATASGAGWTPIGNAYDPFVGVFDGNGHHITGLRINIWGAPYSTVSAGLFGCVLDGVVQDLTLDVTVEGDAGSQKQVAVGGIAAQTIDIIVSNCTVNLRCEMTAGTLCVGGLIGINGTDFDDYYFLYRNVMESSDESAIIQDCAVNGLIATTGEYQFVGGLVGYGRQVFMDTSANYAGISCDYGYVNAAGLVGAAKGYWISGCANHGSILQRGDGHYETGTRTASGIATDIGPLVFSTEYEAVKIIEDSANYATIDCPYGGVASGILYRAEYTDRDDSEFGILNSVNYGQLTAENGSAYGIVSMVNNGIVDSCFNTGSVYASIEAAGIAGKNILGEVTACYNAGALDGGIGVGGIAVMNLDLIEDCYNTGQVAGEAASGISCYNSSYALINNCYNIGGVVSTQVLPAGIAGVNDAVVGNTYYYETLDQGVGQNEITGIDESEVIYLDQLDQEQTYEGFDFGTEEVVLSGSLRQSVSLAGALPGTWSMSSASGLPKLTALPEVYITGISVATPPSATTLLANSSVNLSGLVLKVSYSNGKSVYVQAGMKALPYDKKTGTRTVSVQYAGKTAGFPVSFVNFTAAPASYNSVKLAWNGVTGATGYKLYRATAAAGPYTLMTTASSTARSYTGSGLVSGKTYYYKMVPVLGTTTGTASAAVSAVPKPLAPSVEIARMDSTHTQLAWRAVPGARTYQVYRAPSPAGPYKLVRTVVGCTYNDVQKTSALRSYYKVRAVRLEGTQLVYGLFSLPGKLE
jgi:hypothetical protein